MEKKSFFRRDSDAPSGDTDLREHRDNDGADSAEHTPVQRAPRREPSAPRAPRILDNSDYSENTDSDFRAPRSDRSYRTDRGQGAPRGDRGGERTQRGPFVRPPKGERPDFRKTEKRAPKEPREAPENIIFGVHPLREALQAEQALEKIYMRKGATGDNGTDMLIEIEQLAAAAGVTVQYVPVEKLDRLSRRANHQGVVATIAPIEYADINTVLDGEPKLLLILDGITDVRNFGAIARSAECAGVDAIVVGAKSCAPINGEAMKSSAGALSRIAVCRVGSLRLAIQNIKSAGLAIVAATEKGSQSLFDTDLTRAAAIVMGSEERGISSEIIKLSDERVSIPLMGQIESLNVSAAASILLFETLRQRTAK